MAETLKTIEGVATLAIALYVASIGTFQWLAARQKLRLDLYNRRFEIYVHAISFMQALMEWGSLDMPAKRERRVDFLRSSREARFLFGDDHHIFDLMEEINQRSFRVMSVADDVRPGDNPGAELDVRQNGSQADLKWIIAAIERLEGLLVPYLAFGRSAIRQPPNRRTRSRKDR